MLVYNKRVYYIEMNDKHSTDLRQPPFVVPCNSNNRLEGFWGSTGWTPVKNRLYPSYPFGWHGRIQKTDFPRCQTDPYNNANYLKAQVAPLDNVKPARIGDINLASSYSHDVLDSAVAPMKWENEGDDHETARQLDHMTRGKPIMMLEGEPFIDVRLNRAAHREIVRSAMIITAISFLLLTLFHLYG